MTPQAQFAPDQGLTAEERDVAGQLLQQSHNAVIGVTKCLTDAQWNFKPAPDRWSIAEILEHIVTVQERVLGPVLDHLPKAPAPPEGVDPKIVDSIVIHQLGTRLDRFASPEMVRPTSQLAPREALAKLESNRAMCLARLESMPGLRQHVLPAPPLKAVTKGAYEVMDGYQWILAASSHTERHVKQMIEVMADPAYPV
jgi:hypothetical protein